MSEHAVILRETAISIAINMGMSAAVFAAMFGTSGDVALDGIGRDCVPQTFMVALMGSLVPGLLACRRFAAGRPARVAARALATAIVAAVAVGGAAWLFCRSLPGGTAPFAAAFAAKVALGGVLAAIVTPLSIRYVLACRARRA